jgi:translocator protein
MNKKRPSRINYPLLVGTIALPLLVSVVGAAFTMPEIPSWYANLEKPFFNPPNWIFLVLYGRFYTFCKVLRFTW